MAIDQTITAIPPAGHRGVDTRIDFISNQEDFQDALTATTVDEINTYIDEANSTATAVNTNAVNAATSESEASTAAINAVASSNYQGVWVTQGYDLGQSVSHNGIFYVCKDTHAGQQEPSGSSDYWLTNVPLGANGNISNPLLHMPLSNSLSMNMGVGEVTFSRTTTATYVDRYGVVQDAAIDGPRFEKEGLLIEGVGENLCLYSEQFDNTSGWVEDEVTVTPNMLAAPDGTTTADKVVDSAVHGGHRLQSFPITTTSGTDHSFSVFAKAQEITHIALYEIVDGSSSRFDLVNGTVVSGDGKIEPLADGWYRCTTYWTSSDTAALLNISVDLGGSSVYTGNGTDCLYLWGAQFEELPFASSYIPTVATAVTREADVCQADFYENHPSLQAGNEITFVMDASFIAETYTINRTIFNSGQTYGAKNSILRVGADVTDVNYFRSAGAVSITPASLLNTTKYTISISTNEDILMYENGILKATGNLSLVAPTESGTKIIGIGCRDDATTDFLYGHIKNFKIYDRALTATEVALA